MLVGERRETVRRRPALDRLGFGLDGGEDLLELLGGVHEAVALFELGVHEGTVHDNLKGAARVGGSFTHALRLGKFSLDCILHLLE